MRKVLYVFGLLTDADVAWMARTGLRRRVAEGETVISEGETIGFVAIVLAGELLVATRKARHISRLGVGEVIGEMSLVESAPASATIRAARESLILDIDRHALFAKLSADDGFGSRFYRALSVFLADRLRAATTGIGDGALNGAPSADELDVAVLDNVSSAGERFQRMLQMLRADA